MPPLRSTVAVAALLLAGAASASASPILEPTTQKFLDDLAGSTPIYKLTPAAARTLLHGAQSGQVAHLPAASIEDRTLAVGPTGQTPIRIVRPENTTGALPVIVYTSTAPAG